MDFHTVIKPEEDFEIFGAGSLRTDQRHWRLLEENDVKDEDKAADFADNDLLDGGSMCAHCGAVIARDAPVRRTATGEFCHDICPEPAEPD